MNREQANTILSNVKLGRGKYPERTINAALMATGDLSSAIKWGGDSVDTYLRKAISSGGERIRVWRSNHAAGNSEAR